MPVVAAVDPECWCDWVGSDAGGWTMTVPHDCCPVHFVRPWWCPEWLGQVVLRWRQAAADPERGELTAGTVEVQGRDVVHGWWLSPHDWTLGLAVSRMPGEDVRGTAVIHLGPLGWGLSVYAPTERR